MSPLATAVVAGTVFILTWIAIGLLLGEEQSGSRLLAGVAGGLAFAAVYYYLLSRRLGR
jgi:hypothetical protein